MARIVTSPALAWSAGFLEGEGSFVWSSKHSLRVTAGQVEKAPLDQLQKLFGGSLQLIQRKDRPANHKPIWHWTLTGRAAAGVMMTLWHWMSPRRRGQIEDALARWKLIAPRRPKGHSKRYGDGAWR